MADSPKCPPAGAPMWLATFADLMSLLMCFFVLLLSMASMDVVKFKAVANSLKEAFGVQREVQVEDIPMGTSVIMEHFTPAQVTPTVLEEIKQSVEERVNSQEDLEKLKQMQIEKKQEEINQQAEKIKDHLKDEIDKGMVTVEVKGFEIILRINEKGSFASASANLQPGFDLVMDKITDSISESEGKIIVAGHTDNIPIRNISYRSNWELSSSRAVSVTQLMIESNKIDPSRFLIEGHADTHPLAPNDSAKNRAINRRVEIVLIQNNDAVNEDSTKTTIQTDNYPDKKP
ncbi:MAG: flagellar motor protein MotB [Gammaproteobacteria bacterium]